jgi:hypothetical protein
VDRVHERWTTARSCSPHGAGRGGVLVGVWPPATLGHGSSPERAQKREGSAGSSPQASPELRQRCGGRATAMKRRWREDLVAMVFELPGSGKVEGLGAQRTGRGSPPFIGVEGRWGRQWSSSNGRLEGD